MLVWQLHYDIQGIFFSLSWPLEFPTILFFSSYNSPNLNNNSPNRKRWIFGAASFIIEISFQFVTINSLTENDQVQSKVCAVYLKDLDKHLKFFLTMQHKEMVRKHGGSLSVSGKSRSRYSCRGMDQETWMGIWFHDCGKVLQELSTWASSTRRQFIFTF